MNYVVSSKTVNNIFSSIIHDRDKREQMKSDVYLILCEYNEEALKTMYNNGKVDGFIAKLILNQWNSNTSDYYKNWKNSGFRKSLTRDAGEFNLDLVENETEGYNKYINDIHKIVENTHWYHKTLFTLYFYEGHTFKQISDMTGIKIISVSNSIKKTIKEIQKTLKSKYKDEL